MHTHNIQIGITFHRASFYKQINIPSYTVYTTTRTSIPKNLLNEKT